MSFQHPKPEKCFMISVMHTGTTSLLDLVKPNGFFHVHGIDFTRLRNQLDMTEVIICPLRHPRRVWESFDMRGKTERSFIDSWHNLMFLDANYNINYIPVDLPGIRDEQLQVVADKLGRTITTDWKPKGQFDGVRPTSFRQIDMDIIFLLPFIRRFYDE